MSTAPGLKRRRRADGSIAHYWVASAISRNAGEYPVKTMRLYGDDDAVAARCRLLTSELQAWLADRNPKPAEFDGTMEGLMRIYQADPYSPYHQVRENTRVNYDFAVRVLRKAVGKRRIDSLHRPDFAHWHEMFCRPTKRSKGQERVRNAHGLMMMVRSILKFGASMELAGCSRALNVIALMEFKHPRARKITMTYQQAAAIVEQALTVGRRSVALAQALQFELTLRQSDVIGMWARDRDAVAGITFHGLKWSSGVTWGDLANGTILPKETSKTGQLGEWDLARYPLIVRVLTAIPAGDRIGPMIVDESTGRPYLTGRFARVWREIADAVGVPREVWNRDSRSGGLTEGGEAGAAVQDLQKLATHTNFRTTSRYVRKGLEATNRVADLRVARRSREQSKKGS